MRIEEYEVVMLMLSVGVLIFGFVNLPRLRRVERGGFLVGTLAVFSAGVVLTVLESFFVGESPTDQIIYQTINLFEHLAYLVSTAMLTLWCWWVFGTRKEAS